MDDFFDAVDFLSQEEKFFDGERLFAPLNKDLGAESDFLYQREKADMFGAKANEKIENFYRNESFVFSEKNFDEPFFPSASGQKPSDIFTVNYNIENSDQNTQNDVFNSIEEVSSVENVQNSNKNTVINIDARSYNSISKNVDLDSVSDYIADKLYEVISASSEVIHNV